MGLEPLFFAVRGRKCPLGIVFLVQRRRWGEISDPTHCGRNRPGRFPSGIAWMNIEAGIGLLPVGAGKACTVVQRLA
jgi:hypothetical protein